MEPRTEAKHLDGQTRSSRQSLVMHKADESPIARHACKQVERESVSSAVVDHLPSHHVQDEEGLVELVEDAVEYAVAVPLHAFSPASGRSSGQMRGEPGQHARRRAQYASRVPIAACSNFSYDYALRPYATCQCPGFP